MVAFGALLGRAAVLSRCRAPLANLLTHRGSLLCDAQAQRTIWGEALASQEAEKAESFYDSTVEQYAQIPLDTLSLQQMLSFGRDAWNDPDKILRSARYVQRELPKRLARRLLDLQLLPFIVVNNPHIKRVYNAYFHAFEMLRQQQVDSLEDNTEFLVLLRRLVDEHAPMLDALASGLRECKSKALVGSRLALDPFLDNMLRSRISRRVIAEQHLQLHQRREGYIGLVCTDLDIADAVEFAGQRTTQVCSETYGVAPEVKISGDLHATLAYIPSHLDYMLYEILKNAMRAVVEHHRGRKQSPSMLQQLPPVQVRICAGDNDVITIKVCDQGGGIPSASLNDVWSYGWTTNAHGNQGSSGPQDAVTDYSASASRAASFGDLMSGAADNAGDRFKMAGLGFGLPMSRLYARYFGGDLRLESLPGYGVDIYLHLQKLQDNEWKERSDDMPAVGVGFVNVPRSTQ